VRILNFVPFMRPLSAPPLGLLNVFLSVQAKDGPKNTSRRDMLISIQQKAQQLWAEEKVFFVSMTPVECAVDCPRTFARDILLIVRLADRPSKSTRRNAMEMLQACRERSSLATSPTLT
jgi:hypothetical protein